MNHERLSVPLIKNDLMNHECIKDLSMKNSIEFKIKLVLSFQKDFRKLNFDPDTGGGGRVTSKIQTYIFTVPSPCNR